MNNFRTRNIQMLVATDVAARGLDVNDLTHIINFNLPDDLESYTHRSGRTGRAGKTGVSVAIVHMREKGRIRRIEKLINKKFEFKKIPSGKEVCASQLIGLIGRVKNVEVAHDRIDRYLPEIESMLEGMSREDLIKHFVSLEFNRFLDYYRGAPDLNVVEKKQPQQREGRDRNSRPGGGAGYTKLFINIGQKEDLTPMELMGMVNDVLPGKPIEFGKIDVTKTATFFEVPAKDAPMIVETLSNFDYDDSPRRVEPAGDIKRSRSPHQAYRRGQTQNPRKRNRGGKRRS
jgi:ATP-dependent RNA helicase DeaD